MAATRSRHISLQIDYPAPAAYEFVANPANLPAWAAGVSAGIKQVGGDWVSDSPFGPVTVRFAEPNPFGVADHDVTVPGGESTHNPVRVLPDGAGCEVVFTLRERPGMTAAEFEADAAAITADLATLKRVLEERGTPR
jgi:hypothetical protein